MKKSLLVCSFMLLVSATSAYAQATRTWVSGVGDDVNKFTGNAADGTFNTTVAVR